MQSKPRTGAKPSGRATPAAGPKKNPGSKGVSAKKGSAIKTGESAAAAAEEELHRLMTELEVSMVGLKAQEAKIRLLEASLAELRQKQAQELATSNDVLQSQQRENERLHKSARDFEKLLDESEREAANLRHELRAALDAAAEKRQQEERELQQGIDGQPGSEMQRLLSRSRRQEERIAAQQADLEAARLRLQRTEQALEAERSKSAALSVRALSHSQLHFVRDSPWLVHVQRERLTGALPCTVLPRSTLAAAGNHLVLESVPQAAAKGLRQHAAISILDLSSGRWTAVDDGIVPASNTSRETPPEPAVAEGEAPPEGGQPLHVSGRAVCSMDGRLLGFGGRCGGQLLGAQFFHPNLQKWVAAPPSADASEPQPAPRHGAAMAYCPEANAAFLFGGQDAADTCLADLWRLDCTTLSWTQLDKAAASRPLGERCKSPCMQEAPPASHGAALAVSADGSRLWLMGGRLESGRCSSTLYWFDLTLRYWARVDLEQPSAIESRAYHAMACIGRFVVVAGGAKYASSGHAAYLRDCSIYDPASGMWEALEAAAFEAGEAGSCVEEQAAVVCMSARGITCGGQPCRSPSNKGSSQTQQPAAFFGSGTCAFVGSKLLVLKPSPEQLLWELWSVDLTLPDEVDRMWTTRRSAAAVVTELALKQDAVEASAAKLSWVPPTANRDKLVSFKLMLTDSDGRAREAYEGPNTSCSVTGLAPSSQYVFCVKAAYDDASFLWSQPVMVVTLAASKAA